MKRPIFFMRGYNEKQKKTRILLLCLYMILFLVAHAIRPSATFWNFALFGFIGFIMFDNVISFILIGKVIANERIVDSNWKYIMFAISIVGSIMVLFY